MTYFIDTHDENIDSLSQQELAEEQFLEQFAALEEGLARLQIYVRSMSENIRLFGTLATHIRQSMCPVSLAPRE